MANDSNWFDAEWYVKTYPLVLPEMGREQLASSLEHFQKIGLSRGYLPNNSAIRFGGSADLRSEGFWTDRDDALDIVENRRRNGAISAELAGHLDAFIGDGYVIVKGALPNDVARKAGDSLAHIYEGGDERIKFTPGGRWHPELLTKASKALDPHVFSEDLRKAVFHPNVMDVVRAIFEKPLLATQSLGFWRGSGQALHQDSAYVTFCKPRQFVGVWTALEDCVPDSGELEYVAGSHKMPPYLFRDSFLSVHEARRLHPEIDRRAASRHFLKDLARKVEQRGLKRTRFLPRRGDVLIWSALLAHGGRPISKERTRKSIVTHFCPSDIVPTYFERKSRPAVEYAEGVYYMTQYYDKNPSPADRAEEHVF